MLSWTSRKPPCTAASVDCLVLADVDHATGHEHREVVPVAGQDADLAVDGAGAHERGLARPHLLVDRDDLDVELLVSHPRSALLLELGGLALDVLDATAQEERLLGQVVVLALGELLERLDGLARPARTSRRGR